MRSDRSRPIRAVPAPAEYEDGADRDDVPDLRAKNPLRRPLSRRVKEIATLLGALTAITGYLAGGGRALIQWAGLAKIGDVTAAVAPLELSQKARETVEDGKFAALDKRLDEMTKAAQAQAQATQALTRIVRKLRPAAATKDQP